MSNAQTQPFVIQPTHQLLKKSGSTAKKPANVFDKTFPVKKESTKPVQVQGGFAIQTVRSADVMADRM